MNEDERMRYAERGIAKNTALIASYQIRIFRLEDRVKRLEKRENWNTWLILLLSIIVVVEAWML